ncbi:MAG: mitochondrial fission ELM1 family protein [Methylobacterium sp.]|uniref:mitochondrial fission ELM1 family protein n=1 Tax=unclassified Methylobacterium TaxID=2615210 RepID=UPI0006F2B1A7|nr:MULTISPECIES: mitochondrial fission ELM1 family protein [unclassified Methylobacterium]KQP07438.1 nucleoside-diphosphate sugar epimerase [Methylobacterium sp. Leaf99]MDO9427492.1 mitochondrial fission ELM1 family protein [Methylobacterium sp.]
MPDPSAPTPSPPSDIARARAWIVTDGKAGDENQCLGIAETLGLAFETRRIAPRPPFGWMAPWGPVDPGDRPGRARGALSGPLPDILIASGRRAVPYLRAVREASGGRTFTAFLKDPRTGPQTANFVWVPDYDDLRAENVFTTLTAPHQVSAARLAAARARPDPRLAPLPWPRIAVLIGGDSRHLTYRNADMRRLVRDLTKLSEGGCSLMLTVSRRTPPALRDALQALVAAKGGFFWDGTGENPYIAMLALAEAIVVTSDSANMVGEAVSTGAPVLLFDLPKTYIRHRRLFAGLAMAGALKPFIGRLETLRYGPLDATPAIAQAMALAYDAHVARLAAGRPERL